MPDYPDAIDHFVDPSRVFADQNSHSAIVLHATAGPETWTAQQLGDYFRTTTAETSSHFGIDRAGVVCQYVRLADGAAANCCLEAGHDPFWDQFNGDNLNIHTISIEHINDDANSLALTPAQQAASFKLVAWLCNRYGLNSGEVLTHASIAPSSRHHCPGPAFPLDELDTFLDNGGNMVPQGWNDDGSTLTAPNGHKVVLGFRDYVLNNAWDANNVPLEEEHNAYPVEDYYDQPGANSGARQMFLYSELIWTPQRGVYMPGIGNELMGCRADRDKARADLATAQTQPNDIITKLRALFTLHDEIEAALKQ